MQKKRLIYFLSFAHPIDLFKQKKKSCVFGLKKSGRGSSSSGSSGTTNRSADVSNIICLTACVFGLKKGGGRGGAQPPPRGGLGGAEPPPSANFQHLSPPFIRGFACSA